MLRISEIFCALTRIWNFWSEMEKKAFSLKGKYLVQNFWLYIFLALADAFWSLWHRKKYLPPSVPKKILVSLLGHLGDVVIATSVLPVLKRAFPHAKLGFLIASWSKVVVENHPFVDKLHFLDHSRLNRSKDSFWKKRVRHWKSFFSSFQELRKEEYDLAIDLYFYYPNSIFLLSLARIPRRIGYSSGGFGALLTEKIDWTLQQHYIVEYYKPLLKKIGVEERLLQNMKPFLGASSEENEQSLLQKLSKTAQEKGYWVLHMGAGDEKKEWPLEKWRNLTKKISGEGFFIVFTGLGEEERKKIEWVRQDLANTQNLCNELSWKEFALLIQKATLLLSVDTVAIHVAYAFGIPTLVLFSGRETVTHQCPPQAKSAFHVEEYFSCYRVPEASKECFSAIKEEEVFLRAKEFI